MLVKTVIDNENGKKWEIVKLGEDDYTVNYYEHLNSIGWRAISGAVEHWSKEAIEWEFECEVA